MRCAYLIAGCGVTFWVLHLSRSLPFPPLLICNIAVSKHWRLVIAAKEQPFCKDNWPLFHWLPQGSSGGKHRMCLFLIHLKPKALTIAMRPESRGKQQTKDADPILLNSEDIWLFNQESSRSTTNSGNRPWENLMMNETGQRRVTSYKLP